MKTISNNNIRTLITKFNKHFIQSIEIPYLRLLPLPIRSSTSKNILYKKKKKILLWSTQQRHPIQKNKTSQTISKFRKRTKIRHKQMYVVEEAENPIPFLLCPHVGKKRNTNFVYFINFNELLYVQMHFRTPACKI